MKHLLEYQEFHSMSGELSEKALKAPPPKLSIAEKTALRAYTGYHYQELNRQLRSGSLNEKNEALKEALQSALSKCPENKDPVYRKTSNTIPADVTIGYRWCDKGFCSFTSDINIIDRYEGDTILICRAGGGHDISAFSVEQDEKEILFDSGTIFEIINIKVASAGQIYYEVIAISEEASSQL